MMTPPDSPNPDMHAELQRVSDLLRTAISRCRVEDYDRAEHDVRRALRDLDDITGR